MRIMFLIVAALLANSIAWGADASKSDAAIRSRMLAVETALNSKDAAAYAACFTPDADRIGLANEMNRGRAEIEAAAKSMMAGWSQNQRVKLTIRSIRHLTDDVALAEAQHDFSEGGARRTRATWTLTRQQDQWLVAATRIYEAESAPAPASSSDLPFFTAYQRWDRMGVLWTSLANISLAYSKSKGDGVEAYGRYFGKHAALGWPQNLTPLGFARGIYRNFAAWDDGQGDLIAASDSSVTLKISRPYVADANNVNTYGITADDLDTLMRVVHEEIANARGLVYEQRRDGEHLVITVRRK